jgi:hypothetical protein
MSWVLSWVFLVTAGRWWDSMLIRPQPHSHSLKSETVKYGHESHGTWALEWLCWRGSLKRFGNRCIDKIFQYKWHEAFQEYKPTVSVISSWISFMICKQKFLLSNLLIIFFCLSFVAFSKEALAYLPYLTPEFCCLL